MPDAPQPGQRLTVQRQRGHSSRHLRRGKRGRRIQRARRRRDAAFAR
jgi:hypothetical protein